MRCFLPLSCLMLPLLLAVGSGPAQRILKVPSQYKTIQAAINAAYPIGDTVLVAPGTYRENLNLFRKAVVLRSEQGPLRTIIDGGRNGSVITCSLGEGPSTVVDGFTISRGSGTLASGARRGGGIYCRNASPTLQNNIITSNTADWGAGVYCEKAASHGITNNVITGNLAVIRGGGIYCSMAASTLAGNTIRGNAAGEDGGGIASEYGAVTISGNAVEGNTARKGRGGGIYCAGKAAVMIANDVVAYNRASTGGGIYLDGGTVIQATIFGNQAGQSGGGLAAASNEVVVNSILWSNVAGKTGHQINGTPAVSYSDIERGFPGKGNINADPRFLDAATGDFHLRYDSPCREAGNRWAANLPPRDFEGDPRVSGGSVDMGADELHPHLYGTGNPKPGGRIQVRMVGRPGTVVTWALSLNPSTLPRPVTIPGVTGKFHLAWPFNLIPLGRMPARGMVEVPISLPANLPTPLVFPSQALIGLDLTNLHVIRIE